MNPILLCAGWSVVSSLIMTCPKMNKVPTMSKINSFMPKHTSKTSKFWELAICDFTQGRVVRHYLLVKCKVVFRSQVCFCYLSQRGLIVSLSSVSSIFYFFFKCNTQNLKTSMVTNILCVEVIPFLLFGTCVVEEQRKRRSSQNNPASVNLMFIK